MHYSFDEQHKIWLNNHLSKRQAERRSRLERGHQHAELLFLRNVWHPFQMNFEHLHPEYEVLDWRSRSYFADFAWLPGFTKLLIEIKGYQSHVVEMDRNKFCNELNRETFLTSLGFQVISFSFDDVNLRPELCIHLLRMVLSRFFPQHTPISKIQVAENECIRLALQLARPIRPIDVEKHFQIDKNTAINLLKRICQKGWMTPCLGGERKRIKKYQLIPHMLPHFVN